jgi:MFS family permease
MQGLARLLPYALAFTSSLCIMILELVSSRLVARHVGSSLTVWTSVIGIILGGICLGNVLGGRLSDRVDPRRAVGPLFALGAFLTLGSLWMNAEIGRLLPRPDQINWELRTVLVVLIDFLVPATVLGMIGPVVAKIAVEQARRAGSAIGDVYFWGAVGSIAGTLLCGFILQLYFGTSTITLLVAAGLSLLAASMMNGPIARGIALLATVALALGSTASFVERIGIGSLTIGLYEVNYLVAGGYALALVAAIAALAELVAARHGEASILHEELAARSATAAKGKELLATSTGLRDLAALAFLASLTFMALEMVAGRMVTRHLGSSIYGWSSVIAVLLAGLSMGNFLGGKVADFIKDERKASWLFLLASLLTLSVIFLETPPRVIASRFGVEGDPRSLLSQAAELKDLSKIGMSSVHVTWPFRILIVVTAMFFLPALSMGTVSPVVAKLAVDRLRQQNRTGTAIGQVYAWGMVGSILGTFLTGFVLIDFLGTKGVVLVLGTILALSATFLGDLLHAVWAGIPLGLCAIAFIPPPWAGIFSRVVPGINPKSFAEMGQRWGVREPVGDPATTDNGLAWVDESDYYFIKIENEPEEDGEVQRRTLVLDNLIHGYFILNHPERLDYDYEHIYALVGYRAARAGGQVKFKPAAELGPVEEPKVEDSGAKPAEGAGAKPAAPSDKGTSPGASEAIPPAKAESLPAKTPEPSKPTAGEPAKPAEPPPPGQKTSAGNGGGFLSVPPSFQEGQPPVQASKKETASPESKRTPEPSKSAPAKAEPKPETQEKAKAEGEKAETDAAKTPDPTLKDLNDIFDLQKALTEREGRRPRPYLPPVESSSLKTLFLGGGAYCFQRHMQFAYPGTTVDVAEIDPAVTRANMAATGLPKDTPIVTYWGDARQFVELHQDTKKYDLIFGDAFNDFSVPWHLTTREFNEKLKKMLTPDGVYMINIIDVYMSDATAKEKAEQEIKDKEIKDEAEQRRIHDKYDKIAKKYGGFVGSWTKTAMLTFGKDNVYIFGTGDPGEGLRETFVVVASMKPLDLKDLGLRKDDPRYYTPRGRHSTPQPYGEADFNVVVNNRSRGIILTDDFAPVENLLGPVAETRGDRD